ncbi:hypothetical protein GCM10027180_32380 [Microbulbifer echini]
MKIIGCSASVQLSLFIVLMSGCASSKSGIYPNPSASILFDVDNGYYGSLAVDYWRSNVDICFDVKVVDVYLGPE